MPGLKASDLDKVLLVGGSTRIPAVQEAVKKHHRQGAFQGHRTRMNAWLSARRFRAVCSSGEAVKDILLLDVTPLTLGIETLGGVCDAID